MSDTAVRQPPAPTRSGDSLFARLAGVVLSPRETFERIVARPRWFGALAAVVLISAAGAFVLLSTETGQVAILDQQVRQIESFGGTVSDQQYAQMERNLPFMRFIVAGSHLVFGPLMTLAVAAVLFGVFTAGLGGNASFRDVMAVVAHSGAISLLHQLFLLPLNYVRGSMSSATNLGVFVQSVLDETSVVARVLGAIDLFIIWWLIVLAIGLAVLYRRRTAPIAAGLLSVYGVIALAIGLFMSFSSGGA